MSEAPATFMEWSTMVVPTYILYPEGGNNALKVCQHYHQVVRVGHCVGLFVRDSSEHVARDCTGRLRFG